MKACPQCKESKEISEFHTDNRAKDKLTSWCKKCNRNSDKAYALAHKDQKASYRRTFRQANPDKVREYKIKDRYGIDNITYENLLQEQKGLCAICYRPPVKGRLHIDHKEGTKIVRGLLCGPCNRAIGLLREDPKIMASAARYVEVMNGPS